MYGALDGVVADIGGGGNRGAVVQLFTNFKEKLMALSKVQGSTKIQFGVTKNNCRGNGMCL